jgi:hypothetical protein
MPAKCGIATFICLFDDYWNYDVMSQLMPAKRGIATLSNLS